MARAFLLVVGLACHAAGFLPHAPARGRLTVRSAKKDIEEMAPNRASVLMERLSPLDQEFERIETKEWSETMYKPPK